MSSFLAIRESTPSIVVGNCTFDLLFEKIKVSPNEQLTKVFSANPITDTIGYLNLKQLDGAEIESLVPLVDELIKEREDLADESGGTGFDVMGDLVGLKSKLTSAIASLA